MCAFEYHGALVEVREKHGEVNFFPSHHVGPEDPTLVIRLGSKQIFPQEQFHSPSASFIFL